MKWLLKILLIFCCLYGNTACGETQVKQPVKQMQRAQGDLELTCNPSTNIYTLHSKDKITEGEEFDIQINGKPVSQQTLDFDCPLNNNLFVRTRIDKTKKPRYSETTDGSATLVRLEESPVDLLFMNKDGLLAKIIGVKFTKELHININGFSLELCAHSIQNKCKNINLNTTVPETIIFTKQYYYIK